jgi:oleate hydratase
MQRKVLEELLRHLKFDAEVDRILDSSIVTPCYMPFVTSQFLKRKVSDRPDVVPEGSTNLALTGQFVEVPEDGIFGALSPNGGLQTAESRQRTNLVSTSE